MDNSQKEDGIRLATDFRIEAATIISTKGQTFDIRQVFLELNIFEDIFSPVMTGSIIINDANNLINTIPLVGAERLYLQFNKPEQNESFSKTFRIHRLSNRYAKNTQSENYTLHFCSEELILSESIKISKIYKGQLVDSIVRDIATNYLNIDIKNFPLKESFPTSGNRDIVIPNWYPFEAIRWLSRTAVSLKYPSSSYVFYEDRGGFHFMPIEFLSSETPIQRIVVSPRNLKAESNKIQSDMTESQEKTYEVEVPVGFDLLQNIIGGMYSSKLISINPLRQRIDTNDLKTSDFFNKTKRLNKHNSSITETSRLKNALSEESSSFYCVVSSTAGHDRMLYAKNKFIPKINPNQIEKSLLQRNMYMAALSASKISVSLPGDVKFKVGQVIDVLLPAYAQQETDMRTMDELYSGKYFITALRHSINRTSHMCYIELSKESTREKYPLALMDNIAMEILKK